MLKDRGLLGEQCIMEFLGTLGSGEHAFMDRLDIALGVKNLFFGRTDFLRSDVVFLLSLLERRFGLQVPHLQIFDLLLGRLHLTAPRDESQAGLQRTDGNAPIAIDQLALGGDKP